MRTHIHSSWLAFINKKYFSFFSFMFSTLSFECCVNLAASNDLIVDVHFRFVDYRLYNYDAANEIPLHQWCCRRWRWHRGSAFFLFLILFLSIYLSFLSHYSFHWFHWMVYCNRYHKDDLWPFIINIYSSQKWCTVHYVRNRSHHWSLCIVYKDETRKNWSDPITHNR